MYELLEIFENVARMHANSFDKAMENDFYLGIQMACDKILTMMSQTPDLHDDPYVKAVAKHMAQGNSATVYNVKAPSERKKK